MTVSSDESFLARWSRLKRQPDEPAPSDPVQQRGSGDALSAERECDATTGRDTSSAAKDRSEEISKGDEHPAPDFTNFDFDSLDFSSDYRQFMRDGVPQDARNKALRQLWASNPVFSTPDGLDDCCGDFTDAAMVPKTAVVTAYRVGRGFLSDSEVGEWEALGRPREAEVARVEGADGDASDASDASNDTGERDVAEAQADATPADAASVGATDAGGADDAAGCPGAACAAVVKREEQDALEDYERAGQAGKSTAGA